MLRIPISLVCLIVLLFVSAVETNAQTSSQTQSKDAARRAEKEKKEREKEVAKQAERERKEQEKEAKNQTKYESKRPIKVSSEYDRFKDLTVVSLATMLLVGKGDYSVAKDGLSSIYLSGSYGYKGQTWGKPKRVILSFIVLDANWEFAELNNRNLILIVDGERMSLGKMELKISKEIYNLNRQDLSIALSYENFSKIADAKSVEAQLGQREFSFEPRHLEGLRTLIAPPQ